MTPTALLLLVGLFTGDPEDVHVVVDIPYTTNAGYKQQLDLYLPGSRNFPTIVFIHGGSLMSGDRKGFPGIEPYPEIGRNLAGYGIGMVLVSYRLGPAHHWPTMVQDVAAAVGWTKKKIGAYGGDTTRIFLAGHSSGGHLASVVATDNRFLNALGMRPKDLAGCIVMGSSLHPSYDIEDMQEADVQRLWERARAVGAYESIFLTPNDYRDADPCRHVNPDAPRFLIIFGEDETKRTPALEHADLFTGLLSRHGVRSSVDVIENRDHMGLLRMMAEEGDPTVMLIRSFVMRHTRR